MEFNEDYHYDPIWFQDFEEEAHFGVWDYHACLKQSLTLILQPTCSLNAKHGEDEDELYQAGEKNPTMVGEKPYSCTRFWYPYATHHLVLSLQQMLPIVDKHL